MIFYFLEHLLLSLSLILLYHLYLNTVAIPMLCLRAIFLTFFQIFDIGLLLLIDDKKSFHACLPACLLFFFQYSTGFVNFYLILHTLCSVFSKTIATFFVYVTLCTLYSNHGIDLYLCPDVVDIAICATLSIVS